MEAPLSRVEAILQNILGADNVLVPPGSQVEEILQAIYYNTEYEKNPESRVAEILLAIKNKGIYDGPVLSRVEDILIHKLNNIPYTKHKKEDLSRVEQLLLDWLEQGGGEEIIEYTGTFPMTILANGEPLLDYIISGNTTQSGTPTPDNPVMPQGTGERTGNLFDKSMADLYNHSTLGQANTWAYSALSTGTTLRLPCDANTQYTLSIGSTISNTVFRISEISTDDVPIEGGSGGIVCHTILNGGAINNYTFTTASDSKYILFQVNANVMTAALNTLMLNTGSQSLPYEPYGIKIPILSGGTTTPVYLGEVESTRKIKKLVFDGTENFSNKYGTNLFSVVIQSLGKIGFFNSYCTHYKYNPVQSGLNANTQNGEYALQVQSTQTLLAVKDVTYASPEDFKAYLAQQYAAGTPVTVWYVLATPETAVVNEPLMKIGGYADSISKAQAGEDVPTNEKPTETVIDVPTSVKPSEGYIKYTEPTDGPTPKTQVLGTKNHEIYMTSNDEVYVLRR